MTGIRRSRALLILGAGALLVVLGSVQPATAGDAELSRRRAEQRESTRLASQRAAKADGGAPFGLLVIPVDFADVRLPADWNSSPDLAERLTGTDGETLRNYFRVASGDRSELSITIAPLVRLSGERGDYVDPPTAFNAWASRAMATEALTSVRDTGLPLRLLDMDGPDGLPGTADDDGWVDGVLILHAGPGLENGGLVPPLQYYLEDAVTADGVAASSYAVASMSSGLGIWAHETAHLLGLEERYDPRPVSTGDSEVHSAGGLGRFSLMSAGAWGTGAGNQPALPDAYSRWQLGWCDAVDLPRIPTDADTLEALVAGGHAARVWTHGEPGPEFFMLEVRDPVAAAPFDANVPGGSMIVYHVDESVPDGGYEEAGTWLRLRAHVVEADGDHSLRDREDEGSEADLFPGSLGVTALTPTSDPNSAGWYGPSYVSLTGISRTTAGVAFQVSAQDGPAFHATLAFVTGAEILLDLDLESVGSPLDRPTATLVAGLPSLGTFGDGSTSVVFDLEEYAPGSWRPARSITWLPAPDLPAGAATLFSLRVTDGAWDSGSRTLSWQWDANVDAFDFAANWPGQWKRNSDGATLANRWHRWTGVEVPAANGAPVLVCTGQEYSSAFAWPEVSYRPNAADTLTTPAAGVGITALRIVHAWDAETLPTGEGMDGGTLEWVDPSGLVRPAVPVDGWPSRLSAQSSLDTHGRGGFAGDMELGSGDLPVWRIDVVPLPTDGPGPWRLRFVFATNGVYNSWRGWLIARVEPLTGTVPEAAVPVVWDGADLRWTPPSGLWQDAGEPESLDTVGWGPFLPAGVDPAPDGEGYRMAAGDILPYLSGTPRTRHQIRISGSSDWGPLATRSVVVFPDGGESEAPFLGLPWPNPAVNVVQFLLTVADGDRARLRICDLRGRVLQDETLSAGSHLLSWDGSDRHGRPVASGTYIVHVEGGGGSRAHKVVFLH